MGYTKSLVTFRIRGSSAAKISESELLTNLTAVFLYVKSAKGSISFFTLFSAVKVFEL